MIKCAIFDADGTLLDSMEMWRAITYEYPAEKGVSVPENLHLTMNRLSMEQCADMYRELGVPGTTEEVVAQLADCAFNGYRTRVEEKPRAGEFVRLLAENGIKVAVATASQTAGVTAALDRLGILPFVDLLTSCTEIGKSKEHPDIFLRCAQEFDAAPEECVVFEDSAYAMETAKAAGFPVVAVEDASARTLRARIQGVADRCIAGYGELVEELLPAGEDLPLALAAGLSENMKKQT